MYQPDAGQITIDGKVASIHSPADAIRQGIGMIHQHFMLVPSLTVAENVALGMPSSRAPMLDLDVVSERIVQLAKTYGLQVDPECPVWQLAVGEQQRIEIIKALYRGAALLILDEPTAVLTPQEVDDLFVTLRQMTADGHALIFISHKLHEVLNISDRITVLRDGCVVGSVPAQGATKSGLARMMVGREVFMVVDRPPVERGKPVLEAKNLTYINENGRTLLDNASFNVYESEILGIAGVEGNGQTELVEVLTGLLNATSGEACVDDVPVLGAGPRRVREARCAHIPEDRLTNGVAMTATINDNLIVDRYYREPFTKTGLLNLDRIRVSGQDLIKQFAILAPSGELPVGSLSGGNMQKVVVARELSSSPRLLIAAQPTRGVDIGAIEYIHQQLVDQRTNGLAILLVSADLQEVMKLSDRIMVMYNGQIVGIFRNTPDLTEEQLGLYMLGAQRQTPEELEQHQ